MILRQSGDIELDGAVSITISGRLDFYGGVTKNGDVAITTGQYMLYQSNNMRDNISCFIAGAKLSGSSAANGCIER
jgi:hypothetical protein